MANENKKATSKDDTAGTKSVITPGGQLSAADDFDCSSEEGGLDVSTAPGMYVAEKSVNAKGEHAPLRGYLLRTDASKSQKYGDFRVLVFLLTRPTIVVTSSDARVVVPAGTEVWTVMSKMLEKWEEDAMNPNFVKEVQITPDRKEEAKNGNDVWFFKEKVFGVITREAFEAQKNEKIMRALGTGSNGTAPALTAATA